MEADNLRFRTRGLAAPPEGAAGNLDDVIAIKPPGARSPKAKQIGRGQGEGGRIWLRKEASLGYGPLVKRSLGESPPCMSLPWCSSFRSLFRRGGDFDKKLPR